MDRRTFLRQSARAAGMVTACALFKGCATFDAGVPFESKDSEALSDPLVRYLRDYALFTYIKRDDARSRSVLRDLAGYSITEEDLSPLPNVNAKLIPRGHAACF